VHYVAKHFLRGFASNQLWVKKNMPKTGGFQSFNTARGTIAGFEATLWLRKGFGFPGGWYGEPSERFACAAFDFKRLVEHENGFVQGIVASSKVVATSPAKRYQNRFLLAGYIEM
jgi:hypothetical protein